MNAEAFWKKSVAPKWNNGFAFQHLPVIISVIVLKMYLIIAGTGISFVPASNII